MGDASFYDEPRSSSEEDGYMWGQTYRDKHAVPAKGILKGELSAGVAQTPLRPPHVLMFRLSLSTRSHLIIQLGHPLSSTEHAVDQESIQLGG
jgi:hypothetical protein